MTGMHISSKFWLQPDFATKTCGILAKRRVGKTYTASVIAEEMVVTGLPFVALDPTGAWWGLRASADGKKAGLPVVILGGQHGDLPLERGAGRFIADLVVEHPGFYVIDFSLFSSSAAEREFATDFAERLYRRKAEPGLDFPLHLLVDEADRFAPQRVPSGDQRMLGAFEALVRRGGLRGIGTTLISQRAAVVNKNVLEQLDVLIILRTVGPNDRAAVEDYVKAHGTTEQRAELMGSLASLELGEAWIWEPGGEPPVFERIRIRQRRTFNSSATPKVGEKRIEPSRLADVDLAAIKEAMGEFIDRADAQDPAKLHKRIRSLEAELARVRKDRPEPEVREVRIEMPVVPAEIINAISSYRDRITAAHDDLAGVFDSMPESTERSETVIPLRNRRPTPAAVVPPAPARRTEQAPTASNGDNPDLTPAKQRILDSLAWLESVRVTEASKAQVALLVGMSPTGGGFANYLGSLRAAGFIDYPRSGHVVLTDLGRDAAGESDGPRTSAEMQEVLFRRVGPSKARILQALIDAYPEAMTKPELAKVVGMSATGGGFANYLGSLRSVGLIDYPSAGQVVALPVLFLD